MRNVIFTADDYGAIPQIDEGIRSAVSAGKINSVAIFSNVKGAMQKEWGSSVAALLKAGEQRKKENPGYQLEIGIHFSLTSGFAVHGWVPSLCKNEEGEFNSIYDFKFKDNPDIIYDEINAQYEKLSDLLADIHEDTEGRMSYRIMHLSSHHNILTLYKPHFKALMTLAKEKRTPIRSPIVYPYLDAGLYKRIVTVRNMDNNGSRVIRKLREYREEFFADFDRERVHLKKPDLLDASHYGPVPIIRAGMLSEESKVARKKTELLTALDKKQYWAFTREFVFHLIKDDPDAKKTSKTKQWVKEYPGVNYRYFDSRLLEYKSLMSLTKNEMNQARVRFSRWGDL